MRDECMFCMMAERCGKAKEDGYEELCDIYLKRMVDEGRRAYSSAWNTYISESQDYCFDF